MEDAVRRLKLERHGLNKRIRALEQEVGLLKESSRLSGEQSTAYYNRLRSIGGVEIFKLKGTTTFKVSYTMTIDPASHGFQKAPLMRWMHHQLSQRLEQEIAKLNPKFFNP